MHTIPQNVTAYEDRIVGMLVGRQFIYLAIGGVIIFVLLSTNIGPIFIRGFLSLLVGGFAAALALFRPNDRNLDGLLMSYLQAMFGPTEWVWRKDQVPIEKLRLITDELSGKSTTIGQDPSFKATNNSQDNLIRVSRFQTFISERESGMDGDELEFIEQLNFSEPVPQKAFESSTPAEKAPPMLTKQNYAQIKSTPAPEPPTPTLPPRNLPKPVAALAGSSNQFGATITIEGRQQGVHLRSNLRTNRSLSRQLLSSGVISLPIRGERQFDVSDELKGDLQEITNYIQTTTTLPQKPPTKLLSGEPVAPPTAHVAPAAPPPAKIAPTPTPEPQPVAVSPGKTNTVKKEYTDYDRSVASNLSQQISMLSQALPNSGITKGSFMSDSTPPISPSTDNNQAAHEQPDQVKVMPTTPPSATTGTGDLEREARQIEAEVQKGISELEQSALQPAAPVANTPTTTPVAAAAPTPASPIPAPRDYEAEINRLKVHSQELEQKARQAEEELRQLQQQLAGQAPDNHPAVGAQQELVNTFRQQQATSDAHRQQLEQMAAANDGQPHLHAEYAPLPQVAPVITEQTQTLPLPPAPAEAAPPAPPAQLAPSPAEPSPAPATPTPAQPQETGELDLQAKMAAAGVAAEPTVTALPAAPAEAGQASPTAAAPQKAMTLTNQPNIINGTVVDVQGQLLPGVIVVVKNAQGEPKRALKTNKLGQFVVTTPLANGAYSVEVDKKGLSFDIMKVELTGAISPPIMIKSKSS